jgi:GT2 family glycosyltransferase
MIGVVICSYRSSDVIFDCLQSLFGASDCPAYVVVVDNASPDGTADKIAHWARSGQRPQSEIALPLKIGSPSFPLPFSDRTVDQAGQVTTKFTLIRSNRNLGYAGAVNAGLKALLDCPAVSLFWVLNPDAIVTDGVSDAYMKAGREGGLGLFGSRVLFCDPPDVIQSDGGTFNTLTGVCSNINFGLTVLSVPIERQNKLSFISGANMVVTREFIAKVGLMPENYFLYYEEVAWAWLGRKQGFQLGMIDGAQIYHHGGTVIGTGTAKREPSPFALYFNMRNRMRFMRKSYPAALPVAYVYSMLSACKLLLKGSVKPAWAVIAGLHELSPPATVRARLPLKDHDLAFGRRVG